MRSYSPFFQTLHDETGPVGQLGRGTHYSVLRCMSWLDELQRPLKRAVHQDIAIIWDEDHDERVIEYLLDLYVQGILSSIAVLGERKGATTLLVLDSTEKKLGAKGIAALQESADSLSKNLSDPWPAQIGNMSNPRGLISDDDKVLLYLKNIHMLWNLGLKSISRNERGKETKEDLE
jgi:hypothetical protein